jgi:hypothetical protein
MKKLTLILSALVASFSAAKADVSVSGSAGAAYVGKAGTGDTSYAITSGTVAFALSTTTSSGMGISAGMAITQDPDADGSPSVSGGQAVTFTTGGATIVVGDIEVNDEPGAVGGAVGGVLGDNSGLVSSVASGFDDDDGFGVSLSTALGGSTLSIGYIMNDEVNNNGKISSSTAGENEIAAASITMPMGAYTVTAGFASNSDQSESSTGASVAATMGGGTLTVGYSQQTLTAADTAKLSANGDTQVVGATYALALDADTSLKVGYQNAKDGDSESTNRMDASISRSLGGGASVYLDIRNLSGDASTKGTAVAVGTSVAF